MTTRPGAKPSHKTNELDQLEEWGIGSAWRSQSAWRDRVNELEAENRRLREERDKLAAELLAKIREEK